MGLNPSPYHQPYIKYHNDQLPKLQLLSVCIYYYLFEMLLKRVFRKPWKKVTSIGAIFRIFAR